MSEDHLYRRLDKLEETIGKNQQAVMDRFGSLEKRFAGMASRLDRHEGQAEIRDMYSAELRKTISGIVIGVVVSFLTAVGGFAMAAMHFFNGGR